MNLEVPDSLEIPISASTPLKSRRIEKLTHWANLLTKFVSIQLIIQALGFLAGIALVRTLSQHNYTYYTIANTMQATLLLLADVGVGSALTGIGGEVWEDQRKFGELINTGLQVRKTLAWLSIGLSIPVMSYLLHKNGANWEYASLLCAAVLLGAYFRVTNDVLSVVPNLHSRIDNLQNLDLKASVFRLVGIFTACLAHASAFFAVLVASLTFGYQTKSLKTWAFEDADLTAEINTEYQKRIYVAVAQQAPNTIYYCVQGQLTVFLISIFGSTHTLAEVGALGRISVILTIISSVMGRIVLPRYARCQDREHLIQMWWQVFGTFLLISSMFVLAAVFIPGPFLWLLGPKYAHLQRDFAWVIFGAMVSNMAGVIYSLNTAKAWTKGASLSIILTVFQQIVLLKVLHLGTIRSVVLFNSIPAAIGVIPLLYRTYVSIKQMPSKAVSVPPVS